MKFAVALGSVCDNFGQRRGVLVIGIGRTGHHGQRLKRLGSAVWWLLWGAVGVVRRHRVGQMTRQKMVLVPLLNRRGKSSSCRGGKISSLPVDRVDM